MSYININKKELLNWLDCFNSNLITESYNDFNFDLDSYKDMPIEQLRVIRTDIGKELQFLDREISKLSKAPEGINIKDPTCFLQMPKEIIEYIKSWNTIKKSPYSCSMYSEENIGWNYKPDGCFSVSDHWNFFLKGKFHKITDKVVINNTHITLCKFNKNLNPIDGYLIKKKIKNGQLNAEEIEELHKTDGVWEVILSLPKNTTKINQIEKIRQKKTKLKNLLKYLREINSIKPNLNQMTNIQNFDEFNKEISEKKSANNVDIFNKQKNAVIAQNKEYNFEPVPNSFKNTDPNYKYTISKKIPIGSKDPVKKFKEWAAGGRYWRKRKDRKNKYEPQAKQN